MVISQRIFRMQLLLVFLALVMQLPAQENCIPKANGNYLKSYWNAGVYTLTQPARYKTTDWLVSAGFVGSAVLLYNKDQQAFDFFDRQLTESAAKDFSRYSELGGNGLMTIPDLGAMYWAGTSHSDCRLKEASLAGLQAFVLSAGAAWLVKSLAGRPRPNAGYESDTWYGPFSGHDAFPSGHTTRAFAVATVLAGYYKDKMWVGITAYGLATFTASGRLLSGEHWPSDVLVGMALGYVVGRGVLKFNQKQKEIAQRTASSKSLTFSPLLGPQQVGVMIRF
jgi:membrane-associated phospholipid phosphatase